MLTAGVSSATAVDIMPLPAGLTEKGKPFALVPPPPPVCEEGGLNTVTVAVTAVLVAFTRRLVSTVAWICVELMLTMGSVLCVGPKFQCTWEPPDGSEVGRKLVPLTVRVKEALP